MQLGFRRTRTGRFVVRLGAGERQVLIDLAEQVSDLVAPPTTAHADPLAVELGLEDLDAGVDLSSMELLEDRDPVLDRLFPAAYEDDADALEFRRFTEMGLRQQKQANARTFVDSLRSTGDKVTLTRDQAMAWLATFNDMRLALSVRIGIKDEADTARLAALDAESDERGALFGVYEYLSFLQESLVHALD